MIMRKCIKSNKIPGGNAKRKVNNAKRLSSSKASCFGEKSNKSRLYKSFERKQAPSPENNAFYCFSSLFDVNCNFYNVCFSALLKSRLSDGFRQGESCGAKCRDCKTTHTQKNQ